MKVLKCRRSHNFLPDWRNLRIHILRSVREICWRDGIRRRMSRRDSRGVGGGIWCFQRQISCRGLGVYAWYGSWLYSPRRGRQRREWLGWAGKLAGRYTYREAMMSAGVKPRFRLERPVVWGWEAVFISGILGTLRL